MATIKVVQLPRKIEVGTYEFPIQIVNAKDVRLDDGDSLGATYFGDDPKPGDPRCILIAGRMGPKQTLEIVLHEITHAINYVYDLMDEKCEEFAKTTNEEKVATTHGKAWAQFWLDNPPMLRWLNYVQQRIEQERK